MNLKDNQIQNQYKPSTTTCGGNVSPQNDEKDISSYTIQEQNIRDSVELSNQDEKIESPVTYLSGNFYSSVIPGNQQIPSSSNDIPEIANMFSGMTMAVPRTVTWNNDTGSFQSYSKEMGTVNIGQSAFLASRQVSQSINPLAPVLMSIDPLYSFTNYPLKEVSFGMTHEVEARGNYERTITTAEKENFEALIGNSEYLQEKGFTKEELAVFIEKLGRIPGALENLELLSVKNEYVNKGRFAELVRAYFLEQAGYKVEAIGQIVETSLGKTDIDILLKDGTWIENKQVQEISADQKFKDKIDKMAAAVKEELEVNGIKIKRAIFLNQGKISQNAIEHAIEKGIPIFRDLSYADAPHILNILPFYKDLIETDPSIAVQCARGAYKTFIA